MRMATIVQECCWPCKWVGKVKINWQDKFSDYLCFIIHFLIQGNLSFYSGSSMCNIYLKKTKQTRGPSGPEIAHLDELIMICYIVPWWPSWLSDQIAFSNSESDDVWRVSRLPSWILEMNDLAIPNLHVIPVPPIKFWLNLTYCLGGDVVWRISRWWQSWTLEQNNFSNSEFP